MPWVWGLGTRPTSPEPKLGMVDPSQDLTGAEGWVGDPGQGLLTALLQI